MFDLGCTLSRQQRENIVFSCANSISKALGENVNASAEFLPMQAPDTRSLHCELQLTLQVVRKFSQSQPIGEALLPGGHVTAGHLEDASSFGNISFVVGLGVC